MDPDIALASAIVWCAHEDHASDRVAELTELLLYYLLTDIT